jgi:hypothetical protein
METSTHTPGPWHVGDTAPAIVYDATGWAVANAVTYHNKHVDAMQANARLIAAAPCLLAALQAIAEGCSFPEDDVQRAVRDRARAAIAKATGEPHA